MMYQLKLMCVLFVEVLGRRDWRLCYRFVEPAADARAVLLIWGPFPVFW